MCQWFVNNKDKLAAIASFSTVVGTVTGLILVGIMIYQLDSTGDNIKANTIYNIAKDGRDIAEKFKNGDIGVGYLFNYIHAAYHQKRLGTLDMRLWKPIENETCGFLRDEELAPKIDKYWKDENKEFFDEEFVGYVDKLKNSQRCKGKK